MNTKPKTSSSRIIADHRYFKGNHVPIRQSSAEGNNSSSSTRMDLVKRGVLRTLKMIRSHKQALKNSLGNEDIERLFSERRRNIQRLERKLENILRDLRSEGTERAIDDTLKVIDRHQRAIKHARRQMENIFPGFSDVEDSESNLGSGSDSD